MKTIVIAIALLIAALSICAQAGGSLTTNLLRNVKVDVVNGSAIYEGKVTITRFSRVGNLLKATGELDVRINGQRYVQPFSNVTMHATKTKRSTEATCSILNLQLDPIFLDLLGLQISTSQIILNIIAETGAGNLLGNLLCAILGLFDGINIGGIIGDIIGNAIDQLLDAILSLLSGL
jgi:hypothetical protein